MPNFCDSTHLPRRISMEIVHVANSPPRKNQSKCSDFPQYMTKINYSIYDKISSVKLNCNTSEKT